MNAFLVEGRVVMSGNKHIIHVDDEPSFAKFFFEDSVHHHLESGRGVGQTEEHHHWFEEPFVGDEGCFPLIAIPNSYIVVSPSYIEFSEQSSASCFVD